MPVWNLPEKALFVGLFVFAMAAGVIGMHRPMFIDEATSVLLSSHDIPTLIDDLRYTNNLPFYYFFLHWWIRWFGISEVATRIPSVLFYFLGIVAAYMLGEEVSRDSRVGLYSAFFYAVSLQEINLAQKVRMYSLLGLVAGLSTLFFFRAFWASESRRRDWIVYALVNLVGCFTHVWFVFLLFAQLLCHLAFFPRSTLRRFLACLFLPGIALLLLWGRILAGQVRSGVTNWMPPTGLWSMPGAVLEFYGGKEIGALILLACGLLLFAKEPKNGATSHESGKRAQWALLSIVGVSIGVPVTVSVFKSIYFLGRYTIIALPSLAALLGWELARTVRRLLLAGFACVLLLVVLTVRVVSRHDLIENSEAVLTYTQSDKHAAEELNKRIRPGDTLVFIDLSRASVQYYLTLFGRAQEVTFLSYPVEFAHLGWDQNQTDRMILETQARELVQRLSESNKGSGQIWVLAGRNGLTNGFLLDKMDQHFAMLGISNERGAFFSGVVLYSNKPTDISQSR